MPPPRTHYRISLGEYNGQDSWVIQSAKGIKWHNVPIELIMVLQKLSVNELLDFDLGTSGRWYVKYRQKGPEKLELSAGLETELNQGPGLKLDRLTLGAGTDHWGVRKAADGSFERFRSVGNRRKLETSLDDKTTAIKSNNQIAFVSLGHNGDWAFSVNWHVEYWCPKPFQNALRGGWKARKRVATIALSPIARVWIIVWDDGSLSHNLPSSIASDVDDYCQLQHSLKNVANGSKQKGPKGRAGRSNQPSTAAGATPAAQTTQQASSMQPTPSAVIQAQISSIQHVQSINTQASAAAVPVSIRPSVHPTLTQQNNPTATANSTQIPNMNTVQSTASRLAPPPVVRATPGSTVPPSTSPPSIQQTSRTSSGIQSTINSIPAAPARHPSRKYPPPPLITTSNVSNIAPTIPVVTPTRDERLARPQNKVVSARSARVSTWLGVVDNDDDDDDRLMGTPNVPARPRTYYVAPPPPPKKMTTTLRMLDEDDIEDAYNYEKISQLFRNGWKHRNKTLPKVLRIFAVSLPDHLNESYEAYKVSLGRRHGWDGINEKLLFHGTSRHCSLGEGDSRTDLCAATICCLCSILRTSFLVSKATSIGKAFKRFGPGIYTSSVSSKADDYTNNHVYWDSKVVIVARVALGKGSVHYRDTVHLTEPPYGYDSVLGEVGLSLNHDEQVLYKNEAVRPAYIVIYETPTPVIPKPRPIVRPAPVQNTSTFNPPQTTTANWFGQPTTTTTTNTNSAGSSGGCTIM